VRAIAIQLGGMGLQTFALIQVGRCQAGLTPGMRGKATLDGCLVQAAASPDPKEMLPFRLISS